MESLNWIEYNGSECGGSWLIYKYLREELMLGSWLRVRQGQEVHIFVNGDACGVFHPGTYLLSSETLPLAEDEARALLENGTPVAAEIYFVNVTATLQLNWGTQSPFKLEDPKYGLILSIRAYGKYGLEIRDAKLFISRIVGSVKEGAAYNDVAVAKYFNSLLTSKINPVISNFMIQKQLSFLEIAAYLDELSAKCQEEIKGGFGHCGVEVANFYIESIAPPKEEYAKFRKDKEKIALGYGFHWADLSYEIMEKLADNPGANSFLDAGKGLLTLQRGNIAFQDRCHSKTWDMVETAGMNSMDIRYGGSEKKKMTDILIMIATREEEKAIVRGGGWKSEPFSADHKYYVNDKNGVRFALVRGYGMGEADAGIMAQKFIDKLNPKVIAMAGFCAGKKGKTRLGDLIVAAKVYSYEIGKQVSETVMLPEISSYSLDQRWLQFIERIEEGWIEHNTNMGPMDFEWQEIELLNTLRKGISFYKELYDEKKYTDWKEVIDELQSSQLIKINGQSLVLTGAGKSYIDEYMVKNIDNRPPKKRLSIGAIATGTKVQIWSKIFQRLESMHDRKTYALDMESHVIGKLGNINRIPFIVVKGIGDYADDGKAFANRFIEGTSYQSCKFIMDLFTMDEFMPYWRSGGKQ